MTCNDCISAENDPHWSIFDARCEDCNRRARERDPKRISNATISYAPPKKTFGELRRDKARGKSSEDGGAR
jgi:hypothetical protein